MKTRKKIKIITDIISIIFTLLCLSQLFFVGLQKTEGESMSPTLDVHDITLVKRFPIEIVRGDIVICKEGGELLCKRVIAVPGDTIFISEDNNVYINGVLNSEFSLPDTYSEKSNYCNTELYIPSNMYFVMGDNRGNSLDSRFFGPLDKKLIVGRVLKIL